MTRQIFLVRAGPQDPIYGISHQNIAPELTPENWRTKAIVRDGKYICVSRGTRETAHGTQLVRYFVNVHQDHEASRKFSRRDRALEYANSLGPEQGELPEEYQPATYFTMSPGFGAGPVTIKAGVKK